jgi:hypothetical protein
MVRLGFWVRLANQAVPAQMGLPLAAKAARVAQAAQAVEARNLAAGPAAYRSACFTVAPLTRRL